MSERVQSLGLEGSAERKLPGMGCRGDVSGVVAAGFPALRGIRGDQARDAWACQDKGQRQAKWCPDPMARWLGASEMPRTASLK